MARDDRRYVAALISVCLLAAGTGLSGCRGCASKVSVGGGGSGTEPDGGRQEQGDSGTPFVSGDGGSILQGDGGVLTHVGPGELGLDGGPGGTGAGVQPLPDGGGLVLSGGANELRFLWLANHGHGWVSKYDSRTAKEVGRYLSVFPRDCAGSAGPPCENGQDNGLRANQSYFPSRTAIDLFGDVWVGNRAAGLPGAVTKIANDLVDCIDRDKDGRITTSTDKNGDGEISVNPADGEMVIPTDFADPLQYDECVLFSTVVSPTPTPQVAVRALAIAVDAPIALTPASSAGDVWVGIFRENAFVRLSSRNGATLPVDKAGNVKISLSWGPYGAVVDRQQRLWAVQPAKAVLALIDTRTGTLVTDQLQAPDPSCGAYGIGIDGKDRVWLPGWTSGSTACRYDHGQGVGATMGTWRTFPLPQGMERPRGIAVDVSGNVYVSSDQSSGNGARVTRIDAETGAFKPFLVPGLGNVEVLDAADAQTYTSIGVGIDSDGYAWVANASGNAIRIDPTNGAIVRTPKQPEALYTYSDFTGYQLRNFTAPRGTYQRDVSACVGARWVALSWDASTPVGTTLEAYVKVGNTPGDLLSSTTPVHGPFTASPADLVAAGVPRGQLIRVEFVLTSVDRRSTPTLRSFELVSGCSIN